MSDFGANDGTSWLTGCVIIGGERQTEKPLMRNQPQQRNHQNIRMNQWKRKQPRLPLDKLLHVCGRIIVDILCISVKLLKYHAAIVPAVVDMQVYKLWIVFEWIGYLPCIDVGPRLQYNIVLRVKLKQKVGRCLIWVVCVDQRLWLKFFVDRRRLSDFVSLADVQYVFIAQLI